MAITTVLAGTRVTAASAIASTSVASSATVVTTVASSVVITIFHGYDTERVELKGAKHIRYESFELRLPPTFLEQVLAVHTVIPILRVHFEIHTGSHYAHAKGVNHVGLPLPNCQTDVSCNHPHTSHDGSLTHVIHLPMTGTVVRMRDVFVIDNTADGFSTNQLSFQQIGVHRSRFEPSEGV